MPRELTQESLIELREAFGSCQPVINLLSRLPPPEYTWWIEDHYRRWSGAPEVDAIDPITDDVRFASARVLVVHASSVDGRSLSEAGVEPDEDRRYMVVASITLHYFDHPVFGRRPSHVGRTIIANPERILGERVYLLKGSHKVFIPEPGLGRVPVSSFAFAQQEPDSHRCIDVSLWAMFDYLSRHIGSARIPLSLLRSPVHRGVHRLAPMSGLFPDEVMESIARSGLSPVYYFVDEGAPGEGHTSEAVVSQAFRKTFLIREAHTLSWALVSEALHAYLDSQLCPVLIIGRPLRQGDGTKLREPTLIAAHSLCVVGHSSYSTIASKLTSSPAAGGAGISASETSPSLQQQLGFITTTMLIDDLIVHDDDIGPYLRLPLNGTPRAASQHAGDPVELKVDELWWETAQHNTVGFFVALPSEVRLPAETALYICRGVVRGKRWRGFYDSAIQGRAELVGDDVALAARRSETSRQARIEEFIASWDTEQFVLGLYLEHSSRLKQRVLDEKHALSTTEKDVYLNCPLPKYVWVAEISTRSLMEDVATDGGRIVGEIIIDPSRGPYTWSVLIFRAPGVVFFRTGVEASSREGFGGGPRSDGPSGNQDVARPAPADEGPRRSPGEVSYLPVDSVPRVQWTFRNFRTETPDALR